MTKSTKRRKVLKNLSLGTVWSTPLVQSVVIPAHATTTDGAGDPGLGTTTPTPTTPPCSAPMGCYEGLDFAFFWPGGSGANLLDAFSEGANCITSPDFSVNVAVAASVSEAAILLNTSELTVSSIFTAPSLPGACSFYSGNSTFVLD